MGKLKMNEVFPTGLVCLLFGLTCFLKSVCLSLWQMAIARLVWLLSRSSVPWQLNRGIQVFPPDEIGWGKVEEEFKKCCKGS